MSCKVPLGPSRTVGGVGTLIVWNGKYRGVISGFWPSGDVLEQFGKIRKKVGFLFIGVTVCLLRSPGRGRIR
jgi:hypothetical protein